MNKKNLSNKFTYLLAFIIPIIILLFAYYISKIYPFGDKSILFRDLRGQYISYFSEFRNALVGDGSLLYSFTKEMGGNMFGLSAYYTMSPLNLIFALFPKNMLNEAVLVLILIKTGLCGLTSSIFFKNNFKKFGYFSLIFSTAYALIGYNIIYQSNIMWLDGVILLPLVMLGMNNLIREKKIKLYVATLALSLITNFYIGFIICIFITLYFIYKLVLTIKEEVMARKEIIERIKYFIIGSLCGGLLSAFVTLPTIFALSGGKAKFEFFTSSIEANYKFFDIVTKFYINGLGEKDILVGLPNIYCGILIAILGILYFCNRNIKLFEKISSGIMIFILIISFYINKIDLIWHGFNKPVGFPYRYSFVFSFFIILLAYKSFINLKHLSKKSIIITLIGILCVSALVYRGKYVYLTHRQIKISVIFMIVYCVLLFIKKLDFKFKNIINVLLALILFFELGVNGYQVFNTLKYNSRSGFVDYINNTQSVIDSVKAGDNSFYRMDKTFNYNLNDPMLLNYNGITHFSSVYKTETRDFIRKLGFISTDVWFLYDMGSTVPANSLLNIKYIITKDKEAPLYNESYKLIDKEKDMNIYENTKVLPLGFMVNNDISKLDINNEENLFKVQDNILNSMTGKKENYFERIEDYNLKLNNVTRDGNTYNKVDSKKKASININLKAKNEDPMYLYIGVDDLKQAEIYLNNKKISYFSKNNQKIMPLGSFKSGESLDIRIDLKEKKFNIDNLYLYSLNNSKFNKTYEELSKNAYKINYYDNSDIKGEVISTGDNDILYTSIPWDDGWKVTIDGKKADKIKIMDSLIGVKVPEGKHNIDFTFMPKGLAIGSTISIITLAVIFIVWALTRRKKAK